jgi:chromosome segregation ATPase
MKHVTEIKTKLQELKEEKEELEDMISYISNGHEELKTQLIIDNIQIETLEEVLTKYQVDPDIVTNLLNIESAIRQFKEERESLKEESNIDKFDELSEKIWNLEQKKDILEWAMRTK